MRGGAYDAMWGGAMWGGAGQAMEERLAPWRARRCRRRHGGAVGAMELAEARTASSTSCTASSGDGGPAHSVHLRAAKRDFSTAHSAIHIRVAKQCAPPYTYELQSNTHSVHLRAAMCAAHRAITYSRDLELIQQANDRHEAATRRDLELIQQANDWHKAESLLPDFVAESHELYPRCGVLTWATDSSVGPLRHDSLAAWHANDGHGPHVRRRRRPVGRASVA
jgi:hypothetical protein